MSRRNHSNEDVSSNSNSKNTNSTTTPISTTKTSRIASSKHKEKHPTFIEKQFLNYGLRSIHVPAGLLLFNGMLWVEWLSILVLSVRYAPLRRLMRTQPRMVHFHNNLQQFRLFNRVENWVTKSADRMSANRTFLKLGRHLNTTPDNLTYATIETIVLYNAGLIFFAPFNFVTSVVILRKYFGSKSNENSKNDDGGDNSSNSSNNSDNNSNTTASDSHNHGTNNVAIHPNVTENMLSYDDTSTNSNGYEISAKQLTIEFPNILSSPFENSKVTQIDFDYFGIKSENENENNNSNDSNDNNSNNNSGKENNIRINHHNGKLNINGVFSQSRNDKNMNNIGNSNITASGGSGSGGGYGGTKLFDISQYPYEMASIFLSPLVSKTDTISNKCKKIDESLSSSIISANLKNWSENLTVSSNYSISISNKSDGKARNVESKRGFDCYFNRFNTSRIRQSCTNMASSLFGYMKDWNSNSYACNNNHSIITQNNMNVTSNGSIIVNNYTKSYLNQIHNIVESRLRQNRYKKRNGSINPRKLLSMSAFERFKFEYFR